jgi:hypothetical protein
VNSENVLMRRRRNSWRSQFMPQAIHVRRTIHAPQAQFMCFVDPQRASVDNYFSYCPIKGIE